MAAYIHCNFQSSVLKMAVDVSVLIPDRHGTVKCRTLYLLHGFSGDHMSYLRSSNIERYADEYRILVVMPSMYNSVYTDMKYGLDYFTYLSEELMDFIEFTFPVSTKREDRFAAGMSMGGYGAYKLGLYCPDKFCAVGGIAGSYHAEQRYQGKVTTVSTLCEALYGDPPRIVKEQHDIFTLLEKVKETGGEIPRLYTCCGTEDRRYQDSVDLKEFADAHGIPLVFEYGTGKHDAEFFDKYIQRILKWML